LPLSRRIFQWKSGGDGIRSSARLGFLTDGVGLQLSEGQVVINEFVATSSDRLLQRAPGTYPRVGNTAPWQAAAYDDSLWSTGAGPFGFGAFTGVTIATATSAQMQNRAASLYLRKTFTVTPTQAASGATLQLLTRYNDGFIAFINGEWKSPAATWVIPACSRFTIRLRSTPT
jgi:hypothetical protein